MSRQGGGLEHARSLRRASHFAPASLLSDSQPAMPRSASAQSIPRQGGSSVAASGMMPASSGSKPPRPAQSHNRKPSDKLRKQRNGPSVDSTASNGASRNANLDRRKSRVDGLLKQKRQSVSFAAAESQGLMPGQPDLPPPVPGGDYSMAPRQQPRRQDRALATALEDELAREDFNADTFLRHYLADSSGSTSDRLKALKSNLTGTLGTNAVELQRSVLSNYSNFVLVSKELSSLENEMLELRSVLEEWRAVPDSLQLSTESDLGLGSSLGPSSGGGGRRGNRNSIADLAALRRSQLEDLWENVEGSQKFLPPVPDRHLIADNANFVEHNSATYKLRGNVHLFLLNDAMLVAIKRRRQMGSNMKLVADKCFILNEIVVVDLKDNGELKNAIKIKKGKETFIFSTEKLEDKKALLLAFKKVSEETIRAKRRQSTWEAESRKEGTGSRSSIVDMPLPRTAFNPAAHFGFGTDDPSGKDTSWVGDVSNELTVRISLREFEDAVSLIEKAKKAMPLLHADSGTAGSLRLKIDSRSAELSSVLMDDLRASTVAKSAAVKISAWLLRLGDVDRARDTFLAGRATLVKRRVKQIKFEGDIGAYISELAVVVFTLIKNTCEWYMAAFKDNKLASGFVAWATEQLQIFTEMFKRQVYGTDTDRKLVHEALAVTQSHALVVGLSLPAIDLGMQLMLYACNSFETLD